MPGEQHFVDDRCLAVVDMGYDSDVSDILH
jgi:hypothetical protein